MSIESPALPYDFSDLEPAMSRDTVVFHFLRHQRVCFDRMRTLVRGSGLEALPLEELIRVTERSPAQHMLYCHAAEVWNHNLFWRSMRPRGGGAAHGQVAEELAGRFGSYERFVHQVRSAVSAHFGSGWLWLVRRRGTLDLLVTHNAGTPLVRGYTVLFALDLWEHAYYLDHQNRRAAWVTTFLDELVDWEFANSVLEELEGSSQTAVPRVRVPAAVRADRERGLS